MDINEKLGQLAERIEIIKSSILTEEATKTSMIMPFFQLLGYDVFNPLEFVPEYTADVGGEEKRKSGLCHYDGWETIDFCGVQVV